MWTAPIRRWQKTHATGGDHGTTAPGSRASGSATTMAGVGAEAGAVPGPELLGRSRDPGRRATAPAPPAKAVVLTGGEPVRLRQRRRHLLRRARRAPPGAVPRAGGPALPVPLPDPDGRAAAAGAPADSEGGPGQPDRRLRDCPGRGPAELAVPDRPAGERRPALRAGQDGLRRLPRRRPAGLRGGGAPAGGSRHPAGLVLAAVR